MFRIVVCALMWLAAGSALAQESQWHLWELREFGMEGYHIANNRDAYYPYADRGDSEPSEYWDYGIAAKWDLDLMKRGDYGFRWRNALRGESTNVQFRSVEWDFRWGLQLGTKLELFYDHTSRHLLDAAPIDGSRSYRLKNFIGAEYVWYRRTE
jgi:hypothetical protein